MSYGSSGVGCELLVKKLGHSIQAIRTRSLQSLLFKLEHNFVDAEELVTDPSIFHYVVEWLHASEVPSPVEILKLIRHLAETKNGTSQLLASGVFPVLLQLRTTVDPAISDIISELLELLMMQSGESPVKEEGEDSDDELKEKTMKRFLSDAVERTPVANHSRMEMKRVHELLPETVGVEDNKFWFELGVKLQLSDSRILRKAMQLLREAVLQDFPAWYIAQNTTVLQSLLSLLRSTEFESVVTRDALLTLSMCAERMLIFVQQRESTTEEWNEDILLHIYDECYNILVCVLPLLKTTTHLRYATRVVRQCVDSWKCIRDTVGEKMSEVKRAEELMHLIEDVVSFWGDAFMEDPEMIYLYYLFMDILDCFNDITFSMPSSLRERLERLLLDPTMMYAHPLLEEPLCKVLSADPASDGPRSFEECKSAVKKWSCLREIQILSQKGRVSEMGFKELSNVVDALQFEPNSSVVVKHVLDLCLSVPLETALEELGGSEVENDPENSFTMGIEEARTIVLGLINSSSESIRASAYSALSSFLDILAAEESEGNSLCVRLCSSFLLYPDILYSILAYGMRMEETQTEVCQLLSLMFESVTMTGLEALAPFSHLFQNLLSTRAGALFGGLLSVAQNSSDEVLKIQNCLRGLFHRNSQYRISSAKGLVEHIVQLMEANGQTASGLQLALERLMDPLGRLLEEEQNEVQHNEQLDVDNADIRKLCDIVLNSNSDIFLRKTAMEQLLRLLPSHTAGEYCRSAAIDEGLLNILDKGPSSLWEMTCECIWRIIARDAQRCRLFSCDLRILLILSKLILNDDVSVRRAGCRLLAVLIFSDVGVRLLLHRSSGSSEQAVPSDEESLGFDVRAIVPMFMSMGFLVPSSVRLVEYSQSLQSLTFPKESVVQFVRRFAFLQDALSLDVSPEDEELKEEAVSTYRILSSRGAGIIAAMEHDIDNASCHEDVFVLISKVSILCHCSEAACASVSSSLLLKRFKRFLDTEPRSEEDFELLSEVAQFLSLFVRSSLPDDVLHSLLSSVVSCASSLLNGFNEDLENNRRDVLLNVLDLVFHLKIAYDIHFTSFGSGAVIPADGNFSSLLAHLALNSNVGKDVRLLERSLSILSHILSDVRDQVECPVWAERLCSLVLEYVPMDTPSSFRGRALYSTVGCLLLSVIQVFGSKFSDGILARCGERFSMLLLNDTKGNNLSDCALLALSTEVLTRFVVRRALDTELFQSLLKVDTGEIHAPAFNLLSSLKILDIPCNANETALSASGVIQRLSKLSETESIDHARLLAYLEFFYVVFNPAVLEHASEMLESYSWNSVLEIGDKCALYVRKIVSFLNQQEISSERGLNAASCLLACCEVILRCVYITLEADDQFRDVFVRSSALGRVLGNLLSMPVVSKGVGSQLFRRNDEVVRKLSMNLLIKLLSSCSVDDMEFSFCSDYACSRNYIVGVSCCLDESFGIPLRLRTVNYLHLLFDKVGDTCSLADIMDDVEVSTSIFRGLWNLFGVYNTKKNLFAPCKDDMEKKRRIAYSLCLVLNRCNNVDDNLIHDTFVTTVVGRMKDLVSLLALNQSSRSDSDLALMIQEMVLLSNLIASVAWEAEMIKDTQIMTDIINISLSLFRLSNGETLLLDPTLRLISSLQVNDEICIAFCKARVGPRTFVDVLVDMWHTTRSFSVREIISSIMLGMSRSEYCCRMLLKTSLLQYCRKDLVDADRKKEFRLPSLILKFLTGMSFSEVSRVQIANDRTITQQIYFFIDCQHEGTRKWAFSLIRMLSFLEVHRSQFASRDQHITSLLLCIRDDTIEVRLAAVHALWVLLYNNQKVKALLKRSDCLKTLLECEEKAIKDLSYLGALKDQPDMRTWVSSAVDGRHSSDRAPVNGKLTVDKLKEIIAVIRVVMKLLGVASLTQVMDET